MQETTLYGSAETAEAIDTFIASLSAQFGNPEEGWALVGIHRRGDLLSERLRRHLEASTGRSPATGVLDITLYRDDFHPGKPQPTVRPSNVPFEVDGSNILLIDDVFFTGRTIRAALNLLADFGRPRRVVLAVFIDRRMRELPICPDHSGLVVERPEEEMVQLRLREIDGGDEVVAIRPDG